ncbi:hypothetical protein [Flavobacterium sp. 3HN19-14]|uniref:hypothetical protein n=1 Tax=Flavobacterium sp. 3HN19-14 TaxID=3448133 RepID=UPI003EE22FC3
MKNVLIPTTLLQDTLQAVKIAMAQAEGENCSIILLFLKDTPDTASAAFWLRDMQTELTPLQEEILDKCQELAASLPNCSLKIQYQYGLTSPLLRNFLENKSIGLIILPETFTKSEREINRHSLRLLANCKCPILQLATDYEEHRFAKALYLENEDSNVRAKDVPKMLNGHFSFRIVSQAKVIKTENHEEMTPVLLETIYKNGIDLLIETRKPGKIRLTKKTKKSFNEHFGLPVLSLCEPVY